MACKGHCEKQIYDIRRIKGTTYKISAGGPATLTEKEIDEDFKAAVEKAKGMAKWKFHDEQISECADGCDCVPAKGDHDPEKDEQTDWLERKVPAKPPLDTLVVPATGNPYTVTFTGKFEIRARIEKRICVPKDED